MDLGVHDVRLLVVPGRSRQELEATVHALADWLNAPPYALAHHPIGEGTPPQQELLRLGPSSLRLLACKQSWDGMALIVRIQETTGEDTTGHLALHTPEVRIEPRFRPFEIKTFRIERDSTWREVRMIEEVPSSA
jgi:alpha-mannosidase